MPAVRTATPTRASLPARPTRPGPLSARAPSQAGAAQQYKPAPTLLHRISSTDGSPCPTAHLPAKPMTAFSPDLSLRIGVRGRAAGGSRSRSGSPGTPPPRAVLADRVVGASLLERMGSSSTSTSEAYEMGDTASSPLPIPIPIPIDVEVGCLLDPLAVPARRSSSPPAREGPSLLDRLGTPSTSEHEEGEMEKCPSSPIQVAIELDCGETSVPSRPGPASTSPPVQGWHTSAFQPSPIALSNLPLAPYPSTPTATVQTSAPPAGEALELVEIRGRAAASREAEQVRLDEEQARLEEGQARLEEEQVREAARVAQADMERERQAERARLAEQARLEDDRARLEEEREEEAARAHRQRMQSMDQELGYWRARTSACGTV